MSTLDSRFSREDIETLIEAMGDWELLGNNEYYLSQKVKSIPLPEENHEAHDYILQLKDYFRSREKEINESRITRQEKAVFLKAKLMMARRDAGINSLFDMAGDISSSVEHQVKKTSPPNATISDAEYLENKLELAEYYIQDIGAWDYYQKFLNEKELREEE